MSLIQTISRWGLMMCGRGSPRAASLLTLSLAWSDRSNPSKCAVRTTAEPTTNVRVSVCGEGPGMGRRGRGCSSQTPLPGPTSLPTQLYPSFLRTPASGPRRKLQRKKRRKGVIFSLGNSPQINRLASSLLLMLSVQTAEF